MKSQTNEIYKNMPLCQRAPGGLMIGHHGKTWPLRNQKTKFMAIWLSYAHSVKQ